jgi:hypothetical protein
VDMSALIHLHISFPRFFSHFFPTHFTGYPPFPPLFYPLSSLALSPAPCYTYLALALCHFNPFSPVFTGPTAATLLG